MGKPVRSNVLTSFLGKGKGRTWRSETSQYPEEKKS